MSAPSIFDQEMADRICFRISTSPDTINKICSEPDMPHKSTVYRWLADKPEFRRAYGLAKQTQADLLVDEILDVSNDAYICVSGEPSAKFSDIVSGARLRVESLKWTAARLRPKKYGPKPDETIDIPKKKQIFKVGDIELEF